MRRLAKTLLGTTLATGMLWLAPSAQADHYYAHDMDGAEYHHDYSRTYYDHGYGRPSEVTVIKRYGPAPVVEHHERVVERPVMVHAPRHYPTTGHYPEGYRSATPVILGGILGGVVGNRMGKGHGRDIATVAGVLLGGSIGRDLANGH